MGLCGKTGLATSFPALAAIYLGVEPGTAGAAAAAAAAASAAALAASAAAAAASEAAGAGAAGSTAGAGAGAGAGTSTTTGAGAGAGAGSSFLPQAASAAAAIRAARTREFFISIFLVGQTSSSKAMASGFTKPSCALAQYTWGCTYRYSLRLYCQLVNTD